MNKDGKDLSLNCLYRELKSSDDMSLYVSAFTLAWKGYGNIFILKVKNVCVCARGGHRKRRRRRQRERHKLKEKSDWFLVSI